MLCRYAPVCLSVHITVCAGMHVLEGIHSERDSGIVNFGDSSIEGEGLTSNKRVLILMLEQEILFIELAFPE